MVGSVKVTEMIESGHGEITVDSGAADPVRPVDYMKNILIEPSEKVMEKMLYVAVNGSR